MERGIDELPHTAYAGLVSRLGALAVDIGLITLSTLAVGTLPVLAWEQVSPQDAPAWFGALTRVIAALLPLGYFTAFWWLTGQTVGALVTGVRVRNRHDGRLSLPHAAVRAAGCLLFAPLWLVGLLAVLWDRRRRAWHDRVFATVVCYSGAPTRTGSGPAAG